MKRLRLGAAHFAIGLAALIGGVCWILISLSPPRESSPAILVLALSPKGEWMTSGPAFGKVHVWKAEGAGAGWDIALPNSTLNDLQFSNSGEILAIANKNVLLVSTRDRSQVRNLRNDDANYGTVRFTGDDKTLLSINGKGQILAVDLKTSAARSMYCCTSIGGEVALTPSEKQIVWAGHRPGILDFPSGALLGRLTETREFMNFGPIASDDRGAIYMGSQDGRVYQWNIDTRARIGRSPAQPGYVRTIAVLGGTGWVAYAAEAGPVHVWQPATGDSRVVEGAYTTSNLVFDPFHGTTAFGTSTGEVQFWDLLGNRLLTRLPPVH